MFVCLFVCMPMMPLCLLSYLLVRWKRAGGGGWEGCVRLRWQVPAVWVQGKSCQHTRTCIPRESKNTLTHPYSKWFLSILCRKRHQNNSCNQALQLYYFPCSGAWLLTKLSFCSYLGLTWEDKSSPACKIFHSSWISLIWLVIVFFVFERNWQNPPN